MLKIELSGNGSLGDSKMVNTNVQNNNEKRNFLERMKEREKRQKKKVKISPHVKSAQAEFRKKPSVKGRSPIDNLKTSPEVKNFIKEKFDKEKVKYSFLPEKQVQLQMIQRYKIEIENGKKELPVKEKCRRPLKISMLNASKNNFSPGRKSTRVIDSPPYFAPKVPPCGDIKSVKSVRFQLDYDPDEVKPKMKTNKPPFKSILKVTNKCEHNPVKSQTLRIKIIPDSHSPHIKNLDQYLNELENRNNKVDFAKELNPAARKIVADNGTHSKLADTPGRRVTPVRTKLLFSSPKEKETNSDDLQNTPDSNKASLNVDKLLAESRDDSGPINELPLANPVLEPCMAGEEYPLVNPVLEPCMADEEYPLVNPVLEPCMAGEEYPLANPVLEYFMADEEYPLGDSVEGEETRAKSRNVKVAIILDSHTSPIKSLEVYRDHLERGDQETRFEKLLNIINQGNVENDLDDDLINLRKVDTDINDELTGNVLEEKHRYTSLMTKKSDSTGKGQSFTIISEIQQYKDWYSRTEETFVNRFSSIIEPPIEICSMKEDCDSKQPNLKNRVGDKILYDQHESSSDVEVLPFKKQHEKSSSDLNSEVFFSEDVDMENYTGVSMGIHLRKNDCDTSNSISQTPQEVFEDEEIMYHQNEVGVPIEKTISPELMSSPQCLKSYEEICEVEEADSAMESTENAGEIENDENCKIC